MLNSNYREVRQMSDAVSSAKIAEVRDGFTAFVDKISNYWCNDLVLTELMDRRRYTTQEMYDTLKEVGLFKVDTLSDLTYFTNDSLESFKDWGLVTANNDYLLKGRFTVPIRDITGKVTALVGWYPDNRKYITTPTLGFVRDAQFFNIECFQSCMENNDGVVYLVEGIFDTLSLRSLGFSALGNMGLDLSPFKTQILRRFGKVIAIPDNDKAGKSVNPYCNRFSTKSKKSTWVIENDCVFVGLPAGVKDIDDFIKEFDCYEDLNLCKDARFFRKLRED